MGNSQRLPGPGQLLSQPARIFHSFAYTRRLSLQPGVRKGGFGCHQRQAGFANAARAEKGHQAGCGAEQEGNQPGGW